MTRSRDFPSGWSRGFRQVHLAERVEEDFAPGLRHVCKSIKVPGSYPRVRRPELEVAHHFAAIASTQILQDASLKTRINIFVHEFD